MHRIGAVLIMACALAASATQAVPRRTVPPAFRDALRASGVIDPTRLDRYESLFASAVERLDEAVGRGGSPYRRARRFHRMVHEIVLRRYELDAAGMPALLDSGVYNCVTSTLFYGAAARALGFDAEVVETPRHVFLRMNLDGRAVDIETTSPDGFDLRRKRRRFGRFLLAYKLATPDEIARRGVDALYEEFHGMAGPVSLDDAVSFLWHNSGERWLDAGRPLLAARCFEMRFRIRPGPARQSEALSWALGRAFRLAYDAGDFEDAFEIALIDLRIFPERTTVEDRLLATALKRIELACDRGDVESAVRVLDRALAATTDGLGAARLSLEALPEIVVAAVRNDRWELARRCARRYAVVDPDPVEAGRLVRWVEHRRFGIWVVDADVELPRSWSRRLFPGALRDSSDPMRGKRVPGPLWGSPIAGRPLFRPTTPSTSPR